MMTILTRLLLAAIAAYQKIVSPFLPNSCRFYPSCSQYALQSIETYGAWRGTARAIRRISRCHPWHEGGLDPVEKP
ncbi:MAG: membrane protein insertion efficiency factor YidD [Candidatus Krumholzibacteriia bacterium]